VAQRKDTDWYYERLALRTSCWETQKGVRRHTQTQQVLPIALGYVGYIVLNNLSLQLNTVGFYQVRKGNCKVGILGACVCLALMQK
jgi:uncharacterized membrane protein YeaQ/YmgE (transglycosylase-associated protein family)